MAKRTIVIDDDLEDWVKEACGGVEELLIEYLDENTGLYEAPDLSDLDYGGDVHEVIEGACPIYMQDIADAFYLHGNEIEAAFEREFGSKGKQDEGWPNGWRAAAIYSYIAQEVGEWYSTNAANIYEEWLEKRLEQQADLDKGA